MLSKGLSKVLSKIVSGVVMVLVVAGITQGQSEVPSLPGESRGLRKAVAIPADIPKVAISSRSSFVLAAGGESYFYNPSQKLMRVPFLANVYKPFGFSSDGRFFLYLKSDGKFPTFSLYVYDMETGRERLVSQERVLQAAWSPAGARIAYVVIETMTRFRLLVEPAAGAPAELLHSGWLDASLLQWSPDGSRLLYRTQRPLTDNYFEDGKFATALHEHELATGKVRTIDGGVWGQYEQNRLIHSDARQVVLDGKRMSRLATAEETETPVLSFAFTTRGLYVTRLRGGSPVVEKHFADSDNYAPVASGSLHQTTEDGVVVREFTGNGVTYSFLDYRTEAVSQLLVFSGRYKLPFAGQAFLNQGGALYTATSCDGARCNATSHIGLLGFALDFQQQGTIGQGTEHILAVEDGTVLRFEDNVPCNTGIRMACPERQVACPTGTNGGAGNYVILAHADGSFTSYSHMAYQSLRVTTGQRVCQGAHIGNQGHSGSTGAGSNYKNCDDHLHFQRMGLTTGDPFAQSIATDFVDTPCALSCGTIYASQNTEAPAACVAQPPTVITSNPEGLKIKVDGEEFVTPKVFGWAPGERHTIAPVSPQGTGGSRQTFAGWIDGGEATRTVIAGVNGGSFTARFQLQHFLDIKVAPLGGGTVRTLPDASDRFFNLNTRVLLAATPGPGFQFASWSGDIVTAALEPSITMVGPRTVTANFAPGPTINTGGAVNGADFTASFTQGMILSIFGRNLAPDTVFAHEVPLSTRLGDVSVEIREPGKVLTAPLYFVSPDQINAQLPFESTGPVVEVLVRNNLGSASLGGIMLSPAAPRLFTKTSDGKGEAIVIHGDFTLVSAEAPLRQGEAVFVYVNGLGKVTPPKAKGDPGGDGGALGPLNLVEETVKVLLGGIEARVLFAGLAPGLVGVYQVNFEAPAALAPGVHPIVVRAGDRASQANVTVPVAVGQ